jgi:hypothetical protein
MAANPELEKQWRAKSRNRIRKAVCEAGRIPLRDLQRRTNYNRGPVGMEEPAAIWTQGFEDLENRGEIRLETFEGKSLHLWETDFRQRYSVIWAGKQVMTSANFG